MQILEVENLKVYYVTQRGAVKAVEDVSFNLREKESLGVAGESGCGKSTLGLSLLRLIPPPGRVVGGKIRFDGVDILEMPEDSFKNQIRWRRISMVFQGAMNALNPVYTVGYQLSEPLIYHRGLSRAEASDASFNALKEVGLDERILSRYPHELSGGMKQRIVLAMALILRPDMVIADEPTTALDVIVQAQIINLLKSLKKDLGISIILLTHDLSIISEIADKVAIMYAGDLVEFGDSEQIYYDARHPYTRKLLAAIPRLRGEKRKIEFIPGSPPDLMNPPEGCRFHPRCPNAMTICRERMPPRILMEEGTLVSCWLHGRS